MSQPIDYKDQKDPLDVLITNISQLRDVFSQAEKKKSEHMIGVEYELFAVIDRKLTALQYEGNISIVGFFTYMIEKTKTLLDSFLPIYDDDNLVALKSEKAIVALEPGGQIEIAFRPMKSVDLTIRNMDETINLISKLAQEYGIELLALGFHPRTTNEQMGKVKKSRYKIMHEYMKKTGTMGHDMMNRTASIQINIDYENEVDMVKKMRVSTILSPLLSVLCSNSPFYENKPTKEKCFRLKVWQNTDNARSKIPKVVFEKDFSYLSWINFALDVPMYFIRREGKYLDFTDLTFRNFLNNGKNGYRATLRDFVDHLTTIFTEVRLKPFIELRSTDSMPLEYTKALLVLFCSLIYEQKNLDDLYKKFNAIDYEQVNTLFESVVNLGGETVFCGQKVWNILDELIELSKKSLGEKAYYLVPLENICKHRFSLSDYSKKVCSQITDENASYLIDNFNVMANVADKA